MTLSVGHEELVVLARHAARAEAKEARRLAKIADAFNHGPRPLPSPVFGDHIFIDWLSIAQRHFHDLPIVGDGVALRADSFEHFEHDGEKLACVRLGDKFRYSVPSKEHCGSHSTKLRIRSDGRTVTLSGNPGRQDRPDNVFNYGLDETYLKASQAVAAYGLPAFSPGECIAKHTISQRDQYHGLWTEWTGAVHREIHATKNYSAGNEALAREFMAFAAGKSAARLKKGVFGDESIIFGELAKKGKPLHKALVIYRKAEEMLAHAKGEDAKKRVKQSLEYEFARDTGLVRFELKMGRHYLRDNGLRFMGDASMGKIISIFERETDFLLNASPDRAVRLVSELPTKLRMSALAWIRGDDLAALLPRRTFFRHIKQLREYGLDCAVRRQFSDEEKAEAAAKAEHELSAMLASLPAFELRALGVPDWYGLPELAEAA